MRAAQVFNLPGPLLFVLMSRWNNEDLAKALSRGDCRLSKQSIPQTVTPLTRLNVESPATPQKQRKYRNIPVTQGGERFDSQKEFQRFLDLSMMERAGAISDLKCHPKYVFEHNGVRIGSYKADFSYLENGKLVVEDTKGFRTREFIMKKKMMKAFYDIHVVET